MYVLVFSLSIISMFSNNSASFVVVPLYVLFLYMNHRRHFKSYWTGKLETEESFLLY